MRIVEASDVGKEHLGQVVTLKIGEVFEEALETFPDDVLGLFDGLLVEQLAEQFELQPFAPEVIRGGGIGGPFGLGTIDAVGLRHGQVDVTVQLLHDPGHAVLDPLLIDGEDGEHAGRLDVPEERDVVVNLAAEFARETLFVRREEEETLAVEVGHEVRDHFLVGGRQHRFMIVMRLLEQLDQGAGFRGQRARDRECLALLLRRRGRLDRTGGGGGIYRGLNLRGQAGLGRGGGLSGAERGGGKQQEGETSAEGEADEADHWLGGSASEGEKFRGNCGRPRH